MKQVKTFSEYMNDDTRVSLAEREKIYFEIEQIAKIMDAHKQKGSVTAEHLHLQRQSCPHHPFP